MPELAGIDVALDGHPTVSETIAAVVSAPHVLALTTTLPDAAVSVRSIYLGHAELRTHVTHLIQTPQRTYVATTQAPHDEIPVTHARERCLLHHAAALHDATGAHVDISDDALRAAHGL